MVGLGVPGINQDHFLQITIQHTTLSSVSVVPRVGDTMENTVEISPNLLEIYFAPSILLLEPQTAIF